MKLHRTLSYAAFDKNNLTEKNDHKKLVKSQRTLSYAAFDQNNLTKIFRIFSKFLILTYLEEFCRVVENGRDSGQLLRQMHTNRDKQSQPQIRSFQ